MARAFVFVALLSAFVAGALFADVGCEFIGVSANATVPGHAPVLSAKRTIMHSDLGSWSPTPMADPAFAFPSSGVNHIVFDIASPHPVPRPAPFVHAARDINLQIVYQDSDSNDATFWREWDGSTWTKAEKITTCSIGCAGLITPKRISIAVAPRGKGNVLHICALDSSGRVLHSLRDPAGGAPTPAPGGVVLHLPPRYTRWVDVNAAISGASAVFQDVACTVAGTDLYYFAVADGGYPLKVAVRHEDGSWTPWTFWNPQIYHGHPFLMQWNSIDATTDDAGQIHLVAIANDGNSVFHTMRYANGNWSGWGDVEQQVGQVGAGIAKMNGIRATTCFSNLYLVVRDIVDPNRAVQQLVFARRRASDGTWNANWFAMPPSADPLVPIEMWSDYSIDFAQR